jgi:uncharacterized protein YndB with AHSA1/START domain
MPRPPALRLTATGDASPDVVWERYAEPSQWPSWSPQIRRVDPAHARVAPGLRGVVHGPLGVGAAFRVLAVDEAARTWRWLVRPRVGVLIPIELELAHSVLPRLAGGSLATVTITAASWAATAFAAGYAPIAQLALTRLVRR